MKKHNCDISFGATDPGLIRPDNEDSFFIDPQNRLFIVADGMGGHKAGNVASRYAIKVLKENIYRNLAAISLQNSSITGKWIVDCLKEAGEKIYKQSLASSELSGMGTTVVLAVVYNNQSHIAHVGDSRAYLFRNDQLSVLTKDHSYVNYLVDTGSLDPEAAKVSQFRSKLTQALGMPRITKPDHLLYSLKDNDLLLLCTDGLWEMVADNYIQSILSEGGQLDDLANRLVKEAKMNGGNDNITVVLYRHCSG